MSAKHRVLVVDDEEMIRESIVEILEDSGYQPIAAVDGRDALAKLKTANPRPCVILLDLMMPGMNGWSFREQQRGDPELAPIPVIILSANPDLASNARDLDVADYLEKPLRVAALLERVRHHCPLV